jgi:hypothetical protein
MGDLEPLELHALASEPRVVVVSRRAGSHTVVAARAAVEVEHHGGRAVDEAIVDQKLEQA